MWRRCVLTSFITTFLLILFIVIRVVLTGCSQPDLLISEENRILECVQFSCFSRTIKTILPRSETCVSTGPLANICPPDVASIPLSGLVCSQKCQAVTSVPPHPTPNVQVVTVVSPATLAKSREVEKKTELGLLLCPSLLETKSWL